MANAQVMSRRALHLTAVNVWIAVLWAVHPARAHAQQDATVVQVPTRPAATTPDEAQHGLVGVAGDQRYVRDQGMGWALALSFAPDGSELARIGMFEHARVDTATWTKFRAFDVGIRMLAYSPDGKTIATAEGVDGARLWRTMEPGLAPKRSRPVPFEYRVVSKPRHVLLTPNQARGAAVLAVAFALDGRRLLTADASGQSKIWLTETGALEQELPKIDAALLCAAFHPRGKLIALGDDHGVLHLWDLEHKKALPDVRGPEGPITALTYSADGTRLATTHRTKQGNQVFIWDTVSWKAQVETDFMAAAFSRDGRLLALGGRNIQLIAPATGTHLRTISLPELTQRDAMRDANPAFADKKVPVAVMSLAFRPDGHQLVASCLDGTLRLIPITE